MLLCTFRRNVFSPLILFATTQVFFVQRLHHLHASVHIPQKRFFSSHSLRYNPSILRTKAPSSPCFCAHSAETFFLLSFSSLQPKYSSYKGSIISTVSTKQVSMSSFAVWSSVLMLSQVNAVAMQSAKGSKLSGFLRYSWYE